MTVADQLLFLHNYRTAEGFRTHATSLVAHLETQWTGELVVAHVNDLVVRLGESPEIRLGGRVLRLAGAHARTFGPGYSDTVTASLTHLGIPVVNTPTATRLVRDKFACAAALRAAGVRVPEQTLRPSLPVPLPADVVEHLGSPVVAKVIDGMGGFGVHLVGPGGADIEGRELEADVDGTWVLQRFHAEAGGADLRVLVLDGEVAVAAERRAAGKDFRANLAAGGTMRPVDISAEEYELARAAAAVSGLLIAGVDIIRTDNGPCVLEVNASPGLRALSDISGRDIPAEVARAVVCAVSGARSSPRASPAP